MMIWPRSAILGSDQDGRAQMLVEPLFEIEKMGGPGVVSVSRVFADPGTCGRRHARG